MFESPRGRHSLSTRELYHFDLAWREHYIFPLGNDLKDIVASWIGELRTTHLFAPNDPVFPRTKVGQGDDSSFRAAGIEPVHWTDASSMRTIFRQAFEAAGLPYFPPHSFRLTLGHLRQTACQTPEQMKAWSQNLGHENIGTTLTSYGTIDPHRQGDIIGGISLEVKDPEIDVLAKNRALVA